MWRSKTKVGESLILALDRQNFGVYVQRAAANADDVLPCDPFEKVLRKSSPSPPQPHPPRSALRLTPRRGVRLALPYGERV